MAQKTPLLSFKLEELLANPIMNMDSIQSLSELRCIGQENHFGVEMHLMDDVLSVGGEDLNVDIEGPSSSSSAPLAPLSTSSLSSPSLSKVWTCPNWEICKIVLYFDASFG
jgi:hypothetical protein